MTATDSALSTYLHQETVKPLAEKKTKKKKKADPSPPAAEEKISQVILPRRKVQSPALVLPERETRKAGIAQGVQRVIVVVLAGQLISALVQRYRQDRRKRGPPPAEPPSEEDSGLEDSETEGDDEVIQV